MFEENWEMKLNELRRHKLEFFVIDEAFKLYAGLLLAEVIHLLQLWVSNRGNLKGHPKRMSRLARNAENVQLFPLVWLFCQCVYATEEFFCFECERPTVQPFWCALHKCKAEEGWHIK